MHRFVLAALGGMVFWSGCATQPPYSLQRISEQVPVGSRLEVTAPVMYPAGRDTLWFQDGAIVSSRSINLWTWHCSLDLHRRARSSEARRYENGGFVVSGIEEYSLDKWIDAPVTRFGPLNADIDYTVTVEFSLASPEHPEVKALRCERRFEEWSRERPLELTDVQQQLRGYLAIQPATPEPTT